MSQLRPDRLGHRSRACIVVAAFCREAGVGLGWVGGCGCALMKVGEARVLPEMT